MTSDLSKGKTHFLGDQSPPGTKKGVGTGETGMVSTMRNLPDLQGNPTLAAAQEKDPGLQGPEFPSEEPLPAPEGRPQTKKTPALAHPMCSKPPKPEGSQTGCGLTQDVRLCEWSGGVRGGAHSHKLLRIPRRTQLSSQLRLGEQLLGSVWSEWFVELCRHTV